MAITATQLGQYALNVALPLQNAFITGQSEAPSKGEFVALCGMVVMLAEAVIAIGNATNVNTTVPNSLLTGKWSVVQSASAPIQV